MILFFAAEVSDDLVIQSESTVSIGLPVTYATENGPQRLVLMSVPASIIPFERDVPLSDKY